MSRSLDCRSRSVCTGVVVATFATENVVVCSVCVSFLTKNDAPIVLRRITCVSNSPDAPTEWSSFLVMPDEAFRFIDE